MTPADVHREAAAWIWVPEDARTDDRGDFLLIAYPEHFATPTVATRWAIGFADVDAVLAAARELGRDDVAFFEVTDGELERALRARGAELYETLSVLALDLTGGVPDLDVPADVEVRRVSTLEDLRAAEEIDAAVFGGSVPDDETLAATADRLGEDHRYLALREGRPVGGAGLVVAGETLRLWGAAARPEARHTGVYRALLEHRLRVGHEAGCRMALVKGRVDTSAPVLTRAGFTAYGGVRAYRLGA